MISSLTSFHTPLCVKSLCNHISLNHYFPNVILSSQIVLTLEEGPIRFGGEQRHKDTRPKDIANLENKNKNCIKCRMKKAIVSGKMELVNGQNLV